jgi:hypothetical protein
MTSTTRTVAIVAGLFALTGACPVVGNAGTEPGQQYVSNWAPAYRAFAKV